MLVLSPILPEVAREFGVSTATAGQLRAVSGATGGITALLLAAAWRRPGLRTLLSAGTALIAAGSAASAAAPTFAVLAAAQAVVGVMSMRAAANQFGYLLGAAAGGLALAGRVHRPRRRFTSDVRRRDHRPLPGSPASPGGPCARPRRAKPRRKPVTETGQNGGARRHLDHGLGRASGAVRGSARQFVGCRPPRCRGGMTDREGRHGARSW
jgi:hypothetical protein